MKKKISGITLLLVLITGFCQMAIAQKYSTRTGEITFFSEAPLENIEAVNRQVNSALDVEKGDFVFRLLMRSFIFDKALMQEHFNENYVESHKYPNAQFAGKVLNISEVNFKKDGVYPVTVEGELTIKDVTKKITEKGTFEVKGNEVIGKSTFTIRLADYNVKIPSTVAKNIAEVIEIRVNVKLVKL